MTRAFPVSGQLLNRRDLLVRAGAAAAVLGGALVASGCDQVDQQPSLTARELTEASDTRQAEDGQDLQVLAESVRLAVDEFACQLFYQCVSSDMANGSDTNTLISPLSTLFALALAQNGAEGETLEQLGVLLGVSVDELNEMLSAYRHSLEASDNQDGAPVLHASNSIWLKDGSALTVRDDYLAACSDYLGASVFAAPFDASTVDDINAWVSSHTDKMIPAIIDRLDDGVLAMLVDVLAFEAAWEYPYEDAFVTDETFTCEDGSTVPVKMMRSTEQLYVENDAFTGFMRPYVGGRFALVGLLPKEGFALNAAIATLTGEGLLELLAPLSNVQAAAALPKFSLAYETHMQDVLKGLGITDAFDPDAADFSALGTAENGNLYMSDVLHSTLLDVNEAGTRGAASTAITTEAGSSGEQEDLDVREVTLDRPFVCLVVDRSCGIPIFMGALRALPQDGDD